VPAPAPPIVGRERELAATAVFVRELDAGPAAMVLEGLAGIGKTTIWNQTLKAARADGVVVRSCRCGQSDAAWAFAGLGDLLDDISADITDQLPAVQQKALAAALLQADAFDVALGDRIVGMAVLGVLRALGRQGPLLLAIDDVQWLDTSSQKVLSFALRRLRDEPVRLLSSCRAGPLADLAVEADLGLPSARLVVGPVTVGALQRIVQTQLAMALSRPTLTRLHQATGGNPMVCLEMARALHRRGREPAADEPLPVPADLRVLVTERLRGVSAETRQLLLVAAALAQPTIRAVSLSMGDAEDGSRGLSEAIPAGVTEAVTAGLTEAVAAGLIELDGDRLRFTHPLIASIPYADLTPDARQRLHARIAATLADPEEHARHAALGSVGPDTAVAAALDVAARHARSRGTIDAASELAELAIGRTPPEQAAEVLRRTTIAAEHLFRLGDPARARALLVHRLEAAAPGPARVPGLLLLATIKSWEAGDDSVAALCDQAIEEAGSDVLLLGRCHAAYADNSPSGPAVDLEHAETAVALLEGLPSPPSDLLSNALTSVAMHRLRLGLGLQIETIERAAAMQSVAEPPPISDRAATGLGMCLKVVDRFDESRVWLLAMRQAAIDEGDDSSLPHTLGHLSLLECWSADFPLALDYATQGRELAEETGINVPFLASAHVLVLAHLGRLSEARALGERDLAADERTYLSAVALHLRSLGFTELAAGNPATAAAHLLRALAVAGEIGVDEPAIMRLHPDAIAALVATGRLDEADQLTDELDRSTAANGLPWSTAMGSRCHGLLHSARGEGPRALEALETALIQHTDLPMPFEEARTRLIFGGVLRRAGHRTDARRSLEAARDAFVRFGTPVQAAQAREELISVGGRQSADSELTNAEQRVADLAGAGQTNREVADTLFMSVRTVESHLGRVYRKLGVRSRTELARQRPPAPASTERH
jgi:DNA-binding CsgD family transcriptional regulator